MKKRENQKIKLELLIFLGLILVGFYAYHIVSYSAAVKGLNPEGDQIKQATADRIKRESVIEGSFLDSNDQLITLSAPKGEAAELQYHSFAPIIGYNDSSGSFGLRDMFSEYLYTEQGNTSTGASIKLTINCSLQEQIYSMLFDRDASAVVIENTTGRILALVSTFDGIDIDMNLFHENYEDYEEAGYFLPNATNDNTPPGSSFKVVTVSSVIENGLENQPFDDTGSLSICYGNTIHNNDEVAFGSISAKDALVYSSNTYFASYVIHHKHEFIDMADRFLLGKDIELDFTTLHSSNLSVYSDATVTAMSGFGQGAISLSPLHLAMITQSIANNGCMMKPYLIDSIFTNDKILYSGKSDTLGNPISASTANTVKNYMSEAAESYGVTDIYAKTGTADLESGLTHAVYISFNDDYTVVVTENGTSNYGLSLQNDVLAIFDMLEVY